MANFSQYFAIESKLKSTGFKGTRQELIATFTDGKKESLRDLSPWEYKEFLKWLNGSMEKPKKTSKNAEKCDQMRKKIIAIFHKMGYKLPDGKIDIVRVDQWCIKSGHKHKSLNQHDYDELITLVTQAEMAYKSFILAL